MRIQYHKELRVRYALTSYRKRVSGALCVENMGILDAFSYGKCKGTGFVKAVIQLREVSGNEGVGLRNNKHGWKDCNNKWMHGNKWRLPQQEY